MNDGCRSFRDAKILILGVAYKKDVDDVRESPVLEIMVLLTERDAQFAYHDPYVARLHRMRHYDFSALSTQELTESLLRAQDAVVITTDHPSIDYAWVAEHAPLVVDTRNATPHVTAGREKIIRA